ncbi:MAG: hypothetical protein DRH49_03630 [Candidatus Coatesbacteria bacterium]|nr:MAG: hypothetical protein DRH49_03630 [Candidatus Coatesbacteria bacterium]
MLRKCSFASSLRPVRLRIIKYTCNICQDPEGVEGKKVGENWYKYIILIDISIAICYNLFRIMRGRERYG